MRIFHVVHVDISSGLWWNFRRVMMGLQMGHVWISAGSCWHFSVSCYSIVGISFQLSHGVFQLGDIGISAWSCWYFSWVMMKFQLGHVGISTRTFLYSRWAMLVFQFVHVGISAGSCYYFSLVDGFFELVVERRHFMWVAESFDVGYECVSAGSLW